MKIALAMPIQDHVPGEAFISHLGVLGGIYQTLSAMETGSGVSIITPFNSYPHDRARMDATNDAIADDCDLMFWVDDDMILPRDSFVHLINAFLKHKPVMVSGHYYRRGFPYTCVWSKRDSEGKMHGVDASQGLHRITLTGFGCALMDLRWVQEHLKPPYYTMGSDELGTTVMDDISFCVKVEEAGGEILGHAGIRCGHLPERVPVCDQNVEQLRKLVRDYRISIGEDAEKVDAEMPTFADFPKEQEV